MGLGEKANCCVTCDSSKNQVKYYSIDTRFDHCGESCINPLHFWFFKLFEKGLERAETNTPCADRGYSIYLNTPTHGVWPIKATLDLYDPIAEKTPLKKLQM